MKVANARFSLIEGGAEAETPSFAEAVRTGLSARQKHLPCRFLYDEPGSLLFEEICDLPEYYVTRAEREILERYADEVVSRFDTPTALAELGIGSSTKKPGSGFAVERTSSSTPHSSASAATTISRTATTATSERSRRCARICRHGRCTPSFR